MKDRFKKIRLTLGYSQQIMADMLNIDVRKLRSYEYETKNFPAEFLKSLIDVFNVNINWLLTGEGEMFDVLKSTYIKRKEPEDKSIKGWGYNIQKLRAENGLTIDKFCKLTGIKQKDLITYINDDKMPKTDDLITIVSLFNITIDELLFNHNED